MIARLADDEAAEEEVEQEHLRDCPDCSIWFARYFGGIVAATMITGAGQGGALAIARTYLDQIRNTPDLLNPAG